MYGYYMTSYEGYLHLMPPGDPESDLFQII